MAGIDQLNGSGKRSHATGSEFPSKRSGLENRINGKLIKLSRTAEDLIEDQSQHHSEIKLPLLSSSSRFKKCSGINSASKGAGIAGISLHKTLIRNPSPCPKKFNGTIRRRSVRKQIWPDPSADKHDISSEIKQIVIRSKSRTKTRIVKDVMDYGIDITLTQEKQVDGIIVEPTNTQENVTDLPMNPTVQDMIDDITFDAFVNLNQGHLDDGHPALPVASDRNCADLFVQPKKRQKKLMPNGLAASFSAFVRRESAARTFWKHDHTIPSGFQSFHNGPDTGGMDLPKKPSELIFTVMAILREELHLVQLLCRPEAAVEEVPIPAAEKADHQDQTADHITVVFPAFEVKKSGIGVGTIIRLTEPWTVLLSADRRTTVIMCPYFFKTLRNST